jgi:hypothetical protein
VSLFLPGRRTRIYFHTPCRSKGRCSGFEKLSCACSSLYFSAFLADLAPKTSWQREDGTCHQCTNPTGLCKLVIRQSSNLNFLSSWLMEYAYCTNHKVAFKRFASIPPAKLLMHCCSSMELNIIGSMPRLQHFCAF